MPAIPISGPRQLPPELWSAISEFLEPEDLGRAMGLNRVFYEEYMDLRYRDIELIDLQPSNLYKIVENLKFPEAAGRVRGLTIWPVALQAAIHDVPATRVRRLSLLRNLIRFLKRKPHRQSSYRQENEIKERYHTVESASSELIRVENVNLLWQTAPGEPQFDKTLFTALQPIFGRNLRVLFIEAPLMALVKAHTYLAPLDGLEELELVLDADPTGVVSKADLKEAIENALVPFINRLAQPLEVLSISTKNHADLSPLFYGLGNFPKLHRLMLIIPFDRHHIVTQNSDPQTYAPSGLNRLLVNHPNLQELYILHRPCCKSNDPNVADVAKWVEGCFRSVAFKDLKTLKLDLTAFHLNHVESMEPLARSLSSLIVTQPVLRYADVEKVLRFLTTSRLSSLTLSIETFTPQLLALIAERRPTLEQLDLYIVQCRKAEGAQGPHDEDGFIQGLEADYVYRHQHYDAWALRTLVISMWVYTLGRRPQPKLVDAITAKVPSLRST